METNNIEYLKEQIELLKLTVTNLEERLKVIEEAEKERARKARKENFINKRK